MGPGTGRENGVGTGASAPGPLRSTTQEAAVLGLGLVVKPVDIR